MSGAVVGLSLWLAAALLYRAFALRAVGRVMKERAGVPDTVPPPGRVVLLRPLRGAFHALDPCLESLFAAARRAGAPLRLAAARADDPACAIARRVARRHREVLAELRVGTGPAGRNRKMANLIQGSAGLDADVLVLSDADVRVPTDLVARLVRPFKDTEVGLVTGLYRSVPAGGTVSRLDALVTNTHFIVSVCAALRLEGLHFALGAVIAVRREALRAAGGLEALLETAADDFVLARNMERAGFRLAFVPLAVEHVLENEGAAMAWRRHLRWARVARSVRPMGYLGQVSTHGAAPALSLAVASLLGIAPAALVAAPLLWWGVQIPMLWRMRGVLGLRASDCFAIPLVDVLAFAVFLGGLAGRARPS